MLALVIALWLICPTLIGLWRRLYHSRSRSPAPPFQVFIALGTLTRGGDGIIPNLVNAPELFCLVIALWLGVCLYLSLIDGTPRSYIFMLAGYSVALIGFPAVSDPASIFDTALARVEEITLGIICASLVSTVVFPRSVGPAVAARIEKWLSDARCLSRGVLGGRGSEQASRDQRLRLAADAVEIDMLASHLAHDRLVDTGVASGLRALRLHMLMLLPMLASIGDRIAALGGRLQTLSPELARLLDDLARWIATDGHERQPADRLRAAIAALQPKLDVDASWDRIMIASLLIRLRELVDLSHDCRALSRAIAAGDDASNVELAFRPEAGAAPIRHRDHGMAVVRGERHDLDLDLLWPRSQPVGRTARRRR
jgi:uncharacterized membrane protein YccC